MQLLALTEGPDHVCCRYRIEAYRAALAVRGWTLDVVPLDRNTFRRHRQLRIAETADAVILQRKLLPLWQLRRLRKATAALIYDFDDALFCRDSYAEKGPASWKRLAHFWATIHAADAVFAGNRFLRDQAAAYVEPEKVHLMPTCVDPRQYDEGTAPGAARRCETGVDRAAQYASRIGSSPRDAGGGCATNRRPRAARDLRLDTAARRDPGRVTALVVGDRSGRSDRRRCGDQLASRRSMESGEVQSEGVPVHGPPVCRSWRILSACTRKRFAMESMDLSPRRPTDGQTRSSSLRKRRHCASDWAPTDGDSLLATLACKGGPRRSRSSWSRRIEGLIEPVRLEVCRRRRCEMKCPT